MYFGVKIHFFSHKLRILLLFYNTILNKKIINDVISVFVDCYIEHFLRFIYLLQGGD